MKNLKDTVLREAANNAAVLNCYRERLVFFAQLSEKRRKRIVELEAIIYKMESQQKQPV